MWLVAWGLLFVKYVGFKVFWPWLGSTYAFIGPSTWEHIFLSKHIYPYPLFDNISKRTILSTRNKVTYVLMLAKSCRVLDWCSDTSEDVYLPDTLFNIAMNGEEYTHAHVGIKSIFRCRLIMPNEQLPYNILCMDFVTSGTCSEYVTSISHITYTFPALTEPA